MNEKTITPLGDAFKKCRFVLLAVAIVSLFVNVLMLTVPLYMLQIYGRVLAEWWQNGVRSLNLTNLIQYAYKAPWRDH